MLFFFILVCIGCAQLEQIPGKTKTSSSEKGMFCRSSLIALIRRASSLGATSPKAMFCSSVRWYVFSLQYHHLPLYPLWPSVCRYLRITGFIFYPTA